MAMVDIYLNSFQCWISVIFAFVVQGTLQLTCEPANLNCDSNQSLKSPFVPCFVNNLNSLDISQIVENSGIICVRHEFVFILTGILSPFFSEISWWPCFTGSSRTANIDREFLVPAWSVSRRQWMAQLLKLCTFILHSYSEKFCRRVPNPANGFSISSSHRVQVIF